MHLSVTSICSARGSLPVSQRTFCAFNCRSRSSVIYTTYISINYILLYISGHSCFDAVAYFLALNRLNACCITSLRAACSSWERGHIFTRICNTFYATTPWWLITSNGLYFPVFFFLLSHCRSILIVVNLLCICQKRLKRYSWANIFMHLIGA